MAQRRLHTEHGEGRYPRSEAKGRLPGGGGSSKERLEWGKGAWTKGIGGRGASGQGAVSVSPEVRGHGGPGGIRGGACADDRGQGERAPGDWAAPQILTSGTYAPSGDVLDFPKGNFPSRLLFSKSWSSVGQRRDARVSTWRVGGYRQESRDTREEGGLGSGFWEQNPRPPRHRAGACAAPADLTCTPGSGLVRPRATASRGCRCASSGAACGAWGRG